VGDSVKGCRKVSKDEDADATRLGDDELMDGHVLVKLVGNSPLKDFAEEGKVGDWPVVI